MPSVWDWIQQQRFTGTPEQKEIGSKFDDAMEMHNTDNARCLSLLDECRRLAETHNEPWWMLQCDHWKLQTLLFELRYYDAALDLAVRCAVETRKEKYKNFPQRVCLHEDLINSYAGKDPVGYETEIRNAIAYMENEVAEGMECRHCIRSLKAGLERDLGNFHAAYEAAMEAAAMADAERTSHYMTEALIELCQILHSGTEPSADQYGDILGWSEGADNMLRHQERWNSPQPRKRAHAMVWQAYALLGRGQTDEAKRRFQSAVSLVTQTDAVPSEGYFQAAIAYHELAGEWDKALQVAERHTTALTGKGETWAETRSAWECCRLRAAMGTLEQEEIAKAVALTRRLKNPEKALQVITGGAVVFTEQGDIAFTKAPAE